MEEQRGYTRNVLRSARTHTGPTFRSTRQRVLWAVGLLAVAALSYVPARNAGLVPMTLEWSEVIRAGLYSVVMALLLAAVVVGGTFLVNLALAPARLHAEQEHKYRALKDTLKALTSSSGGPSLRMAERLERDHLNIFRLRLWNDGDDAQPAVSLTRVMNPDGDAVIPELLPIELEWTHHAGVRPALTKYMKEGLTVAVAALGWPSQEHVVQSPCLFVTAMNAGFRPGIECDVPKAQRRRLWFQVTARADGSSVERWFGFEPVQGDVLDYREIARAQEALRVVNGVSQWIRERAPRHRIEWETERTSDPLTLDRAREVMERLRQDLLTARSKIDGLFLTDDMKDFDELLRDIRSLQDFQETLGNRDKFWEVGDDVLLRLDGMAEGGLKPPTRTP